MADVLIGATTYKSYISVADADSYLAARIGADAWPLATTDTRGKALVSATRRIQRYLASRVATVPDPAVDPAPEPLRLATAELAFILLGSASTQDAASSGSNVESVKAGSVAVSFFRPTDQTATVLPQTVQDLVNQYLASVGTTSSVEPPYASGVDPRLAASSFLDEDEFGFTEGLP